MKQRLSFSRRAKWAAITVCIMLAVGLVGVAIAADVPQVFDHFETQPQNITVIFSGPTSASSSAGTGDLSILGGERDLALFATAGSGQINLRAADPMLYPTELAFIASPGQRGYAVVKWDGENNAPLTLDPIGLRGGGPTGVDITNGGLYTGVDFVVTNEDLAASVVITIYTDAANYMQFSQSTVGSVILPRPYYIPFSSFTTTGSPDVTNVGAIVMTINGTAATSAGLDMVFHLVEANGFDFGDLPAAYNNTLLANDGARHLIGDLFLGSEIDVTADGNPSATTTGDDAAGTVPDDEDGVTVVPTNGSQWVDGADGGTVSVAVTGGNGCLTAWLDWNNNSSFGDASDLIINSVLVNPGANLITFDVPAGTFDGTGGNRTFNARFRLKTDDFDDADCSPVSLGGSETDLNPTGLFYNGEVEDYQWSFSPTAVTLNSLEARPADGNNAALVILGVTLVLAVGTIGLVANRRRKQTTL